MVAIVFMGVSGCGKSSAAAAVASHLGVMFMEGDDYHSATNIAKMHDGLPLTDADRAGWLHALGTILTQHPAGLVLTCSSLKRAYRRTLRGYTPDLKFVFLDLSPDVALQRVRARGAAHFMPASLVDSQFATLESPVGEPGVLSVDATLPLEDIQAQVVRWLAMR
jgi:gluconokinase